ncbi:MAG: diadenylate cyclase CdaA [Candidatus Omnitrophica bacterium]|nr:diadenylate cyclase CdaA [Candidatus Omnitrophota bacterium]
MSETVLKIWELTAPLLEIAILWYAVYMFLLFIKGTRTVQVLKGLFILMITFFLSQILDLVVINWILYRAFGIAVIAFLIIFQPELRRGLARLGQNPFFGVFSKEHRKIIDEIIKAVIVLSGKKTGALIGLEREIGLRTYIESGVVLASRVSSEIISTIFVPHTPLHDGGIIIRNGRIQAAGCLFPLIENPKISKTLGTRHRAALGLSQETDAVVVVVSEETGAVSLAVSGKLIRNLDEKGLRKSLDKLYGLEGRVSSIRRHMDEHEEDGLDEEMVS